MKLIYRKASIRALLLGLVILAPLLVALFALEAGIVESSVVTSESMAPTLLKFDRVIVDLRRDDHPRVGDIVTFTNPEEPDRAPLVKRIVGLGDDRVAVRDGRLWVNDKSWSGPMRLGESGRVNLRDLAYEVPPGHFFAVGDNINSSYDSFQFGPLPLDRIRGRLRFIYWPPTRMGRAVLPHGKIPSHPKVEHQGDGGIK